MARTSPYKDFLQPALQRRFASTAGVLLLVSYLQALFLGQWRFNSWGARKSPPSLDALFLFYV